MPGSIADWLDAIGGQSLDDLRRRVAWDDAEQATRGPGDWTMPAATVPPESELLERLAQVLAIGTQAAEDGARRASQYSFEDIWRELAAAGLDNMASRLTADVRAHYEVGFSNWGWFADVRRSLIDDLVGRLSFVTEGAMWRAFNCERSQRDTIAAHIAARETGEMSDRRYRRFVAAQCADGLRGLRSAYPVLDRHLAIQCVSWEAGAAELLTRLHRDHPALLDFFALPHDAKLASIQLNLSDPHRGGRTVTRLDFVSISMPEDEFTLVYKPKDLAIDAAFQAIAAAAPRAGMKDPPLAQVAVLPRDGYGYMAWVIHRPCGDDGELATFYRAAGRLAAILWLLGFSDGHHENLIANGTDLFLIDAETLFEGQPLEHRVAADGAFRRNRTQARIDQSVFRTGLLPTWIFDSEDRLAQDVSALGIVPPAGTREWARGWVALNSDGMMLGEIERAAEIPHSLPFAAGVPNRFSEFSEIFAGGFRDQLVAIQSCKTAWLAANGPIGGFAALRRRFVPRPTWFYQWFRHDLCEAEAMASETAQAITLERLVRSHLLSDDRPANWPIVAAERAQLEQLDIPFFDLAVNGTVLDLPDGTIITDFLEASGYRLCRERIAQLDEAEINFQVALIRGAAAARAPMTRADDRPGATATVASTPGCEAVRIGERIIAAAIPEGDGGVGWLGREATFDLDRRNFQLLGPGLYSGRGGIALFLAALGRWAPDASGTAATAADCATAAITDLVYLLDKAGPATRARWWRDQPLGLAGSGGILLVLLELRDLLPGLAAAIDGGLAALIERLDEDQLRADDRLDIVFGSAGLIGSLLKFNSPRAIALACAAGDNIAARQGRDGAWLVPSAGSRGLTGFSHGAAGIVAALARLHARTGEDRYAASASLGLAYERAMFDRVEGNWPDFRGSPTGAPTAPLRFGLSWCHGAPGIALGRLALAGTALWDDATAKELDAALVATARDVVASDSLCCGRFGRAAILRLAGRRVDGGWDDAAARIGQLPGSGSTSPVYTFLDDISLFTGAAGVGLALLDDAQDLLAGILSANCMTPPRG